MAHLIYIQENGRAYSSEANRRNFVFQGYSGKDGHKNNPESQCEEDLGPIPVGWYSLVLLEEHLGMKNVIRLDPDSANSMCGRSGFLIHGDSLSNPGTASSGCIILDNPGKRKEVADNFKQLEVIARDRSYLRSPYKVITPSIIEDIASIKSHRASLMAALAVTEAVDKGVIPFRLGSGYRSHQRNFGIGSLIMKRSQSHRYHKMEESKAYLDWFYRTKILNPFFLQMHQLEAPTAASQAAQKRV